MRDRFIENMGCGWDMEEGDGLFVSDAVKAARCLCLPDF